MGEQFHERREAFRYPTVQAGRQVLAELLLHFPRWTTETREALTETAATGEHWRSTLHVDGADVGLDVTPHAESRPEVDADSGDHYQVVEVVPRIRWNGHQAARGEAGVTATVATTHAAALLLLVTLVEELVASELLRFGYLQSTAAQRAADEAQVQPGRVAHALSLVLPQFVKGWRVGHSTFTSNPELLKAMEGLPGFSATLSGKKYLLQKKDQAGQVSYFIRRES